MRLTGCCGPQNASVTKQWFIFSIDCGAALLCYNRGSSYCCSIVSSAFWLPCREGANTTIVRTAVCIVDYFKMKEKGKDPALNTVHVCYMN